MADTTPRPLKRVCTPPPSSPLTPPPSSPPKLLLTRLPPAALLLALPGILAHPPGHPLYIPSLSSSLDAIRKCLQLQTLREDLECCAWTAFAEIGMQVIEGGYERNGDHGWAGGVEDEVQHAITKGLMVARKHPALRAYWHQLSILQAELAHMQNNIKFARRLLQRLLSSLVPSDPPHFAYTTHLGMITYLLTPSPAGFRAGSSSLPPSSSPSRSSSTSSQLTSTYSSFSTIAAGPSTQSVHAALATVDTLQLLSIARSHPRITLLAKLLRLRILASAGDWARAGPTLVECEAALGLKYERVPTARGKQVPPPPTHAVFDNAFDSAAAVHVLLLGVVYWTHVGIAAEVAPRLAHLHALMDSGALSQFPDGVVEIPLPGSHPLYVRTTHPRVVFLLTYLVSTVSKRDAVGRNPKRKVFASEGLRVWNEEATKAVQYCLWAGKTAVDDLERKVAMLKADLLCELVAVSIMRSEFDAAEENLNILIAHTHTHHMFDDFASRITLHHAHLAHALGRMDRARQCYRVAAHITPEGSFVHVAARAGDIACMIGERAVAVRVLDDDTMDVEVAPGPEPGLREEECEEVRAMAEECREMGGALEAVGELLEACASSEIVKAKTHLKQALDRASQAQDNHLRALVLALVASYYFHTAGDQAGQILRTSRQLAAGLGGSVGPGDEQSVGNAPLGLWVGERFLELYRRNGEDENAALQLKLNAHFEQAMDRLRSRALPPGNL